MGQKISEYTQAKLPTKMERKAENFITGVLKNDQTPFEKLFILSYQEMSAMNHRTITLVLREAMHTPWSDGVKSDGYVANELRALKTDMTYIQANFNFPSQSKTKVENLSGTIKEISDT
jgi:hypothetical protein